MRAWLPLLLLAAPQARADECSGFPAACSTLTSQFVCQQQDGCSWSSTRDRCSGVALSCDRYADNLSCVSQRGCIWLTRDAVASELDVDPFE